MITNRYTKVLLSVFTIALILNVLDRWSTPSYAVEIENTSLDGSKSNNNCSSDNKTSIKNMKGLSKTERSLSHIESSLNDIKRSISGIDRKLSNPNTNNSANNGKLIVHRD